MATSSVPGEGMMNTGWRRGDREWTTRLVARCKEGRVSRHGIGDEPNRVRVMVYWSDRRKQYLVRIEPSTVDGRGFESSWLMGENVRQRVLGQSGRYSARQLEAWQLLVHSHLCDPLSEIGKLVMEVCAAEGLVVVPDAEATGATRETRDGDA